MSRESCLTLKPLCHRPSRMFRTIVPFQSQRERKRVTKSEREGHYAAIQGNVPSVIYWGSCRALLYLSALTELNLPQGQFMFNSTWCKMWLIFIGYQSNHSNQTIRIRRVKEIDRTKKGERRTEGRWGSPNLLQCMRGCLAHKTKSCLFHEIHYKWKGLH